MVNTEIATPGRRPATMQELAAQIWLLRRVDPGVAYARRASTRDQKSEARNAAVSLFARATRESLSILTMPSLDWSFERSLLQMREHGRDREIGGHLPRGTFICAIERNEALYRAGLRRMPGLRHGLVALPSPDFATATHRTRGITRYHRTSFEDLADWYRGRPEIKFDAAWLDFCGPLTVGLLARIAAFWRLNVRWRLVVTSLRARWPEGTGEAMAEAGGLMPWIRQAIPGRLLHQIEYCDASPMLQVAFEHF